MSTSNQVKFTNHAITRLFERGGKHVRHVPKTASMYARKQEAEKLMASAKETKSFINDTRFMTHLHTKYGYNRSYKAFVAAGMIFLAVVDNDTDVIVTVLNQNEHRVNHFQ